MPSGYVHQSFGLLPLLHHIIGCACLAVAGYAAAGFTFGTVVASAATPAVLVACNSGLGTCSSTCATGGLPP